VAIAIGLLMLGLGLGFSLGIMVMIKKDGKTTTVDAPEGSNVQVNEHGNVTVDLNQLKDQSATDFHRIDLSAADGKAAVPPEPYTIWPGDSLVIRAVGTIIDAPVDGVYVVEPEGTVALPPDYGRVNVKGMSLVEAEPAIVKHLGKVLRSPEVSVTLASWVDRSKPQPNQQPHCVSPGNVLNIWACGTIIDQPIHGPYLVESDGQVTLGPAYGRVNLKGQTFEEAEKTVTKQLNEILRAPEVSITLEGWRKELKPSPEEELKKELAKAKKSIEQLQRANRSKEVTPPKQPEKKKEPNPPDDNKNDLSKGEDKEPKPPAFRTATATRGNIQTMVSATGKLEPERVRKDCKSGRRSARRDGPELQGQDD
jgi:protein involved in polysaccharide export with SLBB domain